MATSTSLSDLNWLSKTFTPPRVTAWGLTQIAADLAGSPPINSTPRLNNAINYMLAKEAEVWAAYQPAWADLWVQAGEPLFQEFLAEMPANMVTGIFADPDPLARGALKTFLRSLEMLFLQFLAVG
jgi:hypothetical protein